MITDKLKGISDEYGTPSFVFDEKALKERVRGIRDIFGPDISLCYSIKANPFLIPAMLDVTDKLEVCSPGELDICKKLGVDPSRIVYSGVNKTEADVRDAAEFGCAVYTAESLRHVMLLQKEGERLCKILNVLPRLNAGSQFGMSKSDLFRSMENRHRLPNIHIEGIHYFVGTQRKKTEHQIKELSMLRNLYEEISATFGYRLRSLEYGPGLPVPYFEGEDFSDTCKPARDLAPALREAATWCRLTVEMGRFFTAECGYYLTRVCDIKSVGSANYCILDGGMNHLTYLGQMMGMKVPVIRKLDRTVQDFYEKEEASLFKAKDAPEAAAGENCDAPETAAGVVCDAPEAAAGEGFGAPDSTGLKDCDYTLCGSLCTTADVLVRQIRLHDLKIGDILAFCNTGAYSVTEGIHLFLSRKMPRIILLSEDGSTTLARDFTDTSSLNCQDLHK